MRKKKKSKIKKKLKLHIKLFTALTTGHLIWAENNF